jgi:hypothetical protein
MGVAASWLGDSATKLSCFGRRLYVRAFTASVSNPLSGLIGRFSPGLPWPGGWSGRLLFDHRVVDFRYSNGLRYAQELKDPGVVTTQSTIPAAGLAFLPALCDRVGFAASGAGLPVSSLSLAFSLSEFRSSQSSLRLEETSRRIGD